MNYFSLKILLALLIQSQKADPTNDSAHLGKAAYEVFNAGTGFLRTFCSSPLVHAVFILSLSSFLLWETFELWSMSGWVS